MTKESLLRNRINGIKFAFRGLWILIKSENSIKVQLGIAILMTLAGFYFDISSEEWMLQLLAIGLVMGIEGVNTAIEKIADYIQPSYDIKIGRIKDISAGAVMIASLMASCVGLLIYLPKIF
jgi:diacylglycerol kinase (ATP)